MGLGTTRQGESCALLKDHLKTEMNKMLGGRGREGEQRQKLEEKKKKHRERKIHREKYGETKRSKPTITQTLKLNFLT